MFRDVIEKTVENGFNVKDEYKTKTVEELREICSNVSIPFRVCALSVEGDLNIGMMARTASLLGAEKFYIFGRRKFDRRSLVGAQNYLPIERIDGLDENGKMSLDKFIEFVWGERLNPVFIEQGGEDIRKANFDQIMRTAAVESRKMCLVFGNEATGIPTQFSLTYESPMFTIPQVGVLRSYNVAAAASMVMWEVFRQWNLGLDRTVHKVLD